MIHEAWTAGRVLNALRRHSLFSGTVVFLLLTGAFSTAVGTGLGLVNFRDVGYPDSATLFKIGEVIHSHRIYPDFSRPPYSPTIYGPLTYVLLAIPYRLAQVAGITPQVLVRLGIVGALCLCVLLVFLISRRLNSSSRPTAWLCALFAVSALPMASWTTQIRGDFLALAFSFLSVYLFLFTNGRPREIGAAICAGIAPLVKQTFLAVPIAIIGWLVYTRRYKEALFWATGFTLTVVGGYAIVWWHEPLILKHIAALRHPVLEYRYALVILWHAVAQPVVPFAAIGCFLALRKRAPEKILFLIYCVVAWLVAILTIPQVGGNINYFWEPLLASAVLAGPGLCEFQRRASRTSLLATAMLIFLLLRSSLPMLRQELDYLRVCYTYVSDYQVRKTKWESFLAAVAGRRLLSTIPEVTFQSVTPEIPDPYLNSTLELRGQWNSGPVVAQINAAMFDLIVIRKGQAESSPVWIYRGVGSWSDQMWGALRKTYGLACVFEDMGEPMTSDERRDAMEVWVPRRGSGEILPGLSAIGCQPVARQVDSGSAADGQSQ
jgi:hypothetical protein